MSDMPELREPSGTLATAAADGYPLPGRIVKPARAARPTCAPLRT